jgi:hypothetical protein
MAAMSTALTEFADNGNSRTYSLSGHTVSEPQLVIQKRRVPVGDQTVSESVVDVVYATTDADGAIVKSKISFSATVRFPIDGQTTDRDAALAVFRDIVAGDEFANTVGTQEWLV